MEHEELNFIVGLQVGMWKLQGMFSRAKNFKIHKII